MAMSKTERETFPGRPEHVMVALEHTLRDMGAEIRSFDPYAGIIQFKTKMTFWSWGENLRATVTQNGPDSVQVEVYSSLQFGLVDWGKNRRNIEKVFTDLRARLAGGSYSWPIQESVPTPEANWLPDPAGRHQLRYWNGHVWTEHVNDHGTPGTDPLPGPEVG